MRGGALLALAGLLASGTVHSEQPLPQWREPNTGMEFVQLPKGCFRMGSEEPVPARHEFLWPHLGMTTPLSFDEHPQHEACVDAVWIGRHEVTARQWERVMGSPPPSGTGDMPASGMSWQDAQRFADRLAKLSGAHGRYRLPTEAEWEYACRAGSTADPVADSDEHTEFAWYNTSDHRRIEPSEVGKLAANAWGLYDVLGNVWEWTADAYSPTAYAGHALYNPMQREAGTGERVIRGASHRSAAQEVRCANRSSYAATAALPQIGLRLVRER